jgi:hypothetical protein
MATTADAADAPIVRAANEILAHQTSDGAIVQGTLPAADSRLVPYFADFAALGLVAAYRTTHNQTYLEAAKRYTDWYVAHQNPNGTIYDYTGGPQDWKATGDYDSTDSYAATFLDLLLAIYRAAPDATWLRAQSHSIAQAVAAIKLTLQPIGLTLAKPTYPVMYTMDNVETARGLRSASELATLLGAQALSTETKTLAERMQTAITQDLWDTKQDSFLIGLQPDGGKMEGLKTWYPDVMANLMAIGWLPASDRNRALFARLKAKFGNAILLDIQTEEDLERLIWWGWAASGVQDAALLKEIRSRLSHFDRSMRQFPNPGSLGHLCRLLAGE